MEDVLSSPDPLNDSPTFQSPPKTRRTSRVRHSLLLASSPTKQTFELDVGNQISPQKIRVTVEAGHSDAENGYTHYVEGTRATGPSPIRPRANRRRERTVTTTVPVKGLSDSEDEVQDAQTPKRGRGRPRKSTGTPVRSQKVGRAGTPRGATGRRRKSIGDLVDGDDEEDLNFQIGTGVQVGRGKGRSRSRSIKGTSRKSTPAAKQAEDLAVSSTTSKKGRGKRKNQLPEEVMILEDDHHEELSQYVNPESDTEGALQPICNNEIYPLSAYSTIRSTTTIGADDADIVIARFDPAIETPQRTGWSSPQIMEAARAQNPVCDDYPTPSVSPDKNENQNRESAGTKRASPEQPQRASSRDIQGEEHCSDAGEDELGEIPEFDTILESEGFSMISVDSVPSLREQLSSPVNQQEKEPSAPRNKNLDFIKELRATVGDDSFSTIPDDVLQAATPARKVQNPNLLSVQKSRIDDSFSSVPPEVLDAATPARKTHLSKLQSRRGSSTKDSISSMAPEALEAASPGRDPSKPRAVELNNSQAYEDSFSAIPSAILDAATPAPARHASPKLEPDTIPVTAASDRLDVPTLSRPNSSGRNTTHLAATRLPTPEETPSPSAESPLPSESTREKAQSGNSVLAPVEQLSVNESSIHSQMRSSPPSVAPRRYTYTAHLRQRRELYPDMTQTPSIVFSSPSLPPPIHIARAQPLLPVQMEEIQRPGLSPIARAGRALQDAVGPTLSPRGRAQSLGSPFKSPVTDRRSSSSIAPTNLSPPQERRVNPLPRSNVAGNLFPNPWNTVKHHDDPFSNDSTSQREKSQAQNDVYTLGLPEQHRLSDPRLSSIRSEGNSVLSDDAMSWQAEEEVTADDADTSLIKTISSTAAHGSLSAEPNRLDPEHNKENSELRWAAERDAVRKQIETASTSQVIIIDSDEESPDGAESEEYDADFGLLLETLNSSSPAVQQPQVLAKDNGEKPRRSKLPSPWRKNSKRLVYSDELSRLSSPAVAANSSLADSWAKKCVQEDDNALDLSSFVVPQKENFKPRVRDSGNLDLSALLASSPNKSRLPVLTKSSHINNSLPQEPGQTCTSTLQTEKSSTGSSRQLFAPIPQKVGFKPRFRDPGDADASSIFGSSPLKSYMHVNNIFGVHSNKDSVVQNPTLELSSSSTGTVQLGGSSPSRSNSLRVPAHRSSAPPFESEFSYNSSISPISEEGKENGNIDNRTLKWTETVRLASAQLQPLVSPTKSCLRSPLKTPSNGSRSGSNCANTSPSKNVAFVSSSPIPSSPTAEPLSSTTWSRDHWLLLDSILQTWKPESNGGSEDGPKERRRNSTRVISRLLGKKVYSQGEEMRLKQWHLEVVDEFRGLVPGWQEKVIAMRVFALIVGEEQRSRGLIGHASGAE